MKYMSTMMLASSSLNFISQKKHALSMLICLEMMMLSTMMIMSTVTNSNNKTQMALFIISFMVAEGATAISVLINFSKSKGNDMTGLMF